MRSAVAGVAVEYEIEATLELDGEERDYRVRCGVTVEPGAGMGGGFGAVLDGEPEAWVGASWVSLEDLEVDVRTREYVADAFAELAFGDDGGADEADYR